nr:hypothetical protein [Tanacetum cinerariifolium]
MIPKPGDPNHEVSVLETFHEQTDDELMDAEIKQMEADDQAIQTILLDFPEDIYADNGNGNVVAAWAEGNGNGNGNNQNQVRCYNCKGLGHLAWNCTVRPRRRDATYLQTQLLITQKEEVGIQLQAKEFDLMAATADLDEIKEVNANCILMANLQQASTSSPQTDKALVYDSDGTAEYMIMTIAIIMRYLICLLKRSSILSYSSPHQVPQNESNVISKKMALGYQNPFYLKQAQQKQQSLYGGNVLLEKHDPPDVYDSEETLGLAQETKFVRDFQSLAKEVDESLSKHKALELENERLLSAVVSQDILSVVLNNSVVDTANLQTELERVDDIAKIKRPQFRSNTKNDRIPSASKSSCSKNKEVEVEEHVRNLSLSKNKKHMSSECNNIKLAIWKDKS